jgi:hypothetical protein
MSDELSLQWADNLTQPVVQNATWEADSYAVKAFRNKS